jgi:hypothetical protein
MANWPHFQVLFRTKTLGVGPLPRNPAHGWLIGITLTFPEVMT